jgi:nucleotide-binding universal stress UspA family protein
MTRVLVPVEILEGESVSYGLMNLLGTMDVTVLGYHVLPEQTPADQAREQFEERAVSALDDLAQEFREAGGDAESRLVFTHDREQTVNRVADDVDARAYAITGATGDVGRLLVPLAGDVAVDRVLDFVTELVGDRDITVTLFLASEADGAEALLDEAADRLGEAGITTETDLVVSDRPFEALVEAVPGHDAIVIGEKAPSLSTFLRGDEAERLASASVGPVLVVRSGRTVSESLGE